MGLVLLGENDETNFQALVNSVGNSNDTEGSNIVLALRENKELAIEQAKRRFLSLTAESESRQALARLAVVLLVLGENSGIDFLSGIRTPQSVSLCDENSNIFMGDPDLKTEFIRAFQSWHDEGARGDNLFRNVGDSRTKALICLAMGKTWASDQRSSKGSSVWADELAIDSEHPYLRASAIWARRQFTNPRLSESLDWGMVTIKPKSAWFGQQSIRQFEILDREITVKEFREFLNDNDPAVEKPLKNLFISNSDLPLQPVAGVSKIDAILFCNWLSAKHGLNPCYIRTDSKYPLPQDIAGTRFEKAYLDRAVKNRLEIWELDAEKNGYRLPTNDEWDAALGDSKAKFFFGNDASALPDFACFGQLDEANATNTSRIVKSKMPNEQGLHDMLGNVAEHTWTMNEANYMTPPRGGAIISSANTIANRISFARSPYVRLKLTGFRVARSGSRDSSAPTKKHSSARQ